MVQDEGRRRSARASRPLGPDAVAAFLASQDELQAFLRQFAPIDLTGVTFPNPLVRIRFRPGDRLHVLAAHQRRHLWQGWNVRRAAEQAAAAMPVTPQAPSVATR